MGINELIESAHRNAKNKGFWEDWHQAISTGVATERIRKNMQNNAIGNRLMLISGEVSEAHEALRKKDSANFAEELADIVIRVADLCGGLNIDLEQEVIKKMKINESRPYKHGKEF